jgi:hypothetical protein
MKLGHMAGCVGQGPGVKHYRLPFACVVWTEWSQENCEQGYGDDSMGILRGKTMLCMDITSEKRFTGMRKTAEERYPWRPIGL